MIDWTQAIGWAGVTVGVCVSLPQIARIYRTHSSKDVAIWTYRLLLITVLCYLVWAIAIGEPIFIVSNAANTVIAGWVLVLKRRYDS